MTHQYRPMGGSYSPPKVQDTQLQHNPPSPSRRHSNSFIQLNNSTISGGTPTTTHVSTATLTPHHLYSQQSSGMSLLPFNAGSVASSSSALVSGDIPLTMAQQSHLNSLLTATTTSGTTTTTTTATEEVLTRASLQARSVMVFGLSTSTSLLTQTSELLRVARASCGPLLGAFRFSSIPPLGIQRQTYSSAVLLLVFAQTEAVVATQRLDRQVILGTRIAVKTAGTFALTPGATEACLATFSTEHYTEAYQTRAAGGRRRPFASFASSARLWAVLLAPSSPYEVDWEAARAAAARFDAEVIDETRVLLPPYAGSEPAAAGDSALRTSVASQRGPEGKMFGFSAGGGGDATGGTSSSSRSDGYKFFSPSPVAAAGSGVASNNSVFSDQNQQQSRRSHLADGRHLQTSQQQYYARKYGNIDHASSPSNSSSALEPAGMILRAVGKGWSHLVNSLCEQEQPLRYHDGNGDNMSDRKIPSSSSSTYHRQGASFQFPSLSPSSLSGPDPTTVDSREYTQRRRLELEKSDARYDNNANYDENGNRVEGDYGDGRRTSAAAPSSSFLSSSPSTSIPRLSAIGSALSWMPGFHHILPLVRDDSGDCAGESTMHHHHHHHRLSDNNNNNNGNIDCDGIGAYEDDPYVLARGGVQEASPYGSVVVPAAPASGVTANERMRDGGEGTAFTDRTLAVKFSTAPHASSRLRVDAQEAVGDGDTDLRAHRRGRRGRAEAIRRWCHGGIMAVAQRLKRAREDDDVDVSDLSGYHRSSSGNIERRGYDGLGESGWRGGRRYSLDANEEEIARGSHVKQQRSSSWLGFWKSKGAGRTTGDRAGRRDQGNQYYGDDVMQADSSASENVYSFYKQGYNGIANSPTASASAAATRTNPWAPCHLQAAPATAEATQQQAYEENFDASRVVKASTKSGHQMIQVLGVSQIGMEQDSLANHSDIPDVSEIGPSGEAAQSRISMMAMSAMPMMPADDGSSSGSRGVAGNNTNNKSRNNSSRMLTPTPILRKESIAADGVPMSSSSTGLQERQRRSVGFNLP